MDIRDSWICTVLTESGIRRCKVPLKPKEGLLLIGLDGMCKVGRLSPQLAGHMLPTTHCYIAQGVSKYLPGKTEIERRRHLENLRAVY